jgi:hypothetical protein
VSSPPTDVATGDSFAFPLEITAGTPGDYTQTFSLVEEGVTWFGDAPLGGGPPDDLIAIHVIVTSPDGGTGASSGGSGGAGGAGAGGSAPDGGIETSSSGGGATTGTGGSTPADGGASASSPTHKSGCSCRIAGDERGDERDDGGAGRGALAALAVAALATRRRRAIIPRAARARAR